MEIPCNDCISLAICLGKIDRFKFLKSTSSIIHNCKILREYYMSIHDGSSHFRRSALYKTYDNFKNLDWSLRYGIED